MVTMTHIDATEGALRDFGLKYISFGLGDKGRFSASTYWPNGDVIRDIGCYGFADSLSEAIAEMEVEVEKAKLRAKTLRTAAECKEAVLDLIREHDAAPASFRDAVDALPVQR